MSEEEIIEKIEKIIIKIRTGQEITVNDDTTIQGLLDLYNKEKEWNNTLLDSLNECGFQAVEMVKDINKNYIPKSKIKQILYPTPENPIELEIQNSKMYKKLLELIGE